MIDLQIIELVEYMNKENKTADDYSKEEIFILGQKAVLRKLQRDEYKKNWYLKNKERLHQKYLSNYAKNRDAIKEKARSYYYDHAEERKAYHRKYVEQQKMTDEEIINEVSMRG